MRLLVISESAPTARADGGNGSTLISAHLLANLPADVSFDLVYFRDRAGDPDRVVSDRAESVHAIEIAPKWRALLAQPFTTLPRASWQRRVASADLALWSRGVDAVYLHGLHVMHLAGQLTPPVVAHEVDPWSLYWRQRAVESGGLRRRYDLDQSRRAERLERSFAASGATIVVVNEADAEALRASTGGRVVAVSNGVTVGHPSAGADPSDVAAPGVLPPGRSLAFVGSLDYPPNVEALGRFNDEVWPLVQAAVPDARMVVAGRRAGPAVLALQGDGIDVVGAVPDVGAVFRSARASVYAGRTGRGTKNSVSESILAGCPVVASIESARGQPTGPHLLVGAEASDLAEHAVRLLLDDKAAAEARRACIEAGDQTKSWTTTAEEMAGLLRDMARASG